MSDLDENLKAILSSLIDTDGTEESNTNKLPDGSSFNDSRLDFDNLSLANCITNDASLHQSSDESVTSLLESRLNGLSETVNTNIEESTSEHLDDVTSFDLDKPIESLLRSTSFEFIYPECSESQNTIHEKCYNSPISSTLNEAQLILGNEQHVSSNETEDSYQVQVFNGDKISKLYEMTALNETHTVERNDVEPQIGELNVIAEHRLDDNHSGEDRSNIEREYSADEATSETIVADEIVNGDFVSRRESKKRRRILVYDDGESDNSELEAERSRLLQSGNKLSGNRFNRSSLSNDEQVDDVNEDINDYYVCVPNEKPGPKSKKQSTYLYNALKAKALLESAIVIPVHRKNKKKPFIDSDDEFSFALDQPIATVDDIGLDDIGLPQDNNIQMPFNTTVETEEVNSIDFVKKEHNVEAIVNKTRLKKETTIQPTSFVKVGPLDRIKTEKCTVNNRRRHKNKELKDIFGLSLNAPYVDTSSDEDYFLPNNANRRNQHYRTQQRGNKSNFSIRRKKNGHIPDDIYFNVKVPLHILYSYDKSSSSDNEDGKRSERPTKSAFQPSTNRILNKMPPVHKIIRASTQKTVSKPGGPPKNAPIAVKPTVFEQLNKLKRLLRVSGIKVNANELLKGSKTFQQRCERIRNILQENGIEGEPTLAKCKRLKKQIKLKDEVSGLDPTLIINSKEDESRPKRSTRRSSRRSYVYDKPDEIEKTPQPASQQLLQKVKEFVDSDSEYEAENQNNNSVDLSKIIVPTQSTEQQILVQSDVDVPSAIAPFTTTLKLL